jgi:uncharacterized protein YhaN
MTFDAEIYNLENHRRTVEHVDQLRAIIHTLRAEKELLEKRYADLEASRETWQKLAAAWEWLAENKRIVPADE